MTLVHVTRNIRIENGSTNDGVRGNAGDDIDVSSDEAATLVRFGWAQYVNSPAEEDSPEEVVEDIEDMTRPYGNAPKSSWVEWGVHCGGDLEELEGLTKVELMSRYGERL